MEQNDNSVLVVLAKIPKNETLLVTVGPVKNRLISPFNHSSISSFSLLFKDTQIQKTSFFFKCYGSYEWSLNVFFLPK